MFSNRHNLGHFAREDAEIPKSQRTRSRESRSSRRTVNVEEASPKAMLAIDGTGFDWSYMAQEEASTNFALMAFSDSEVLRYNVIPTPLKACCTFLRVDLSSSGIEKFKNLNFDGYGVKHGINAVKRLRYWAMET
ncbi:hypothetical protein Tco_0557265 [Tanacetum coccineum]